MYTLRLVLMILMSFTFSHFAFAQGSAGIPSFELIFYKHTQTRDLNNFLGALHTGRYEAIKQSRQVTACPSSDGNMCDSTITWGDGWIMFVDNNDGTQHDANESIIWVENAMEEGFTLMGSENVLHSFSFSPDGDALTNGTFTMCDPRGADSARAVLISTSERPKTSYKDEAGNSLHCP